MKRFLFYGGVICALLLSGCANTKDPVSQLIIHLKERLTILRENKNDPPAAKEAIFKLDRSEDEKIKALARDLQQLNKSLSVEEKEAMKSRLLNVIQEMLDLMEECPTLFLDPEIMKTFEPFELGI